MVYDEATKPEAKKDARTRESKEKQWTAGLLVKIVYFM
jgi:hypothetical protein